MSKALQNQQKKKQKLSDKFLQNKIYQNEKEIYRKAKNYCLKL